MSKTREMFEFARIRQSIDDGVMISLQPIDELDFKPCVTTTDNDGTKVVRMNILVYSPSGMGDDLPKMYTVTTNLTSDINAVVDVLVEKALELPREEF